MDSRLLGSDKYDCYANKTVALADSLMRDLGLVESPSGLLALAKVPSAIVTVNVEIDAIFLDEFQDPGNVERRRGSSNMFV